MSQDGAPYVSVRDLGKGFGPVEVLRGINLDVPKGGLLAVLGASGSGKTTLLRLLCGFERADRGAIVLDGVTVASPGRHVAAERRRVGYVAQDGALFPHLSVADNILFGLPRAGRQDRRIAAGWLERVGLSAELATRGPAQLSGGEQQRVALARALAPGPGLVLLDEPFSALDAALRAETRIAVAAALAAAGATGIVVTHDQSEALSMGDRVAVLREGVLVQVADPSTVYQRPADARLARFVGEAMLLPGQVRDGFVACRLGMLPLIDAAGLHGAVDVMVRPEQIRLSEVRDGGLCARVVETVFYGHDACVSLVVPGEAPHLALIARVAGYAAPVAGTLCALSVEGRVMAYARP